MRNGFAPNAHFFFVLLLASLGGAGSLNTVGPAHAEVWPISSARLLHGPFEILRPGPLSAITNPAQLAMGPGWGIGFGRHSPFEVSEFARSDAALWLRPSAVALALIMSRFGADDIAAVGVGAGTAVSLVPEVMSLGASLWRVSRDAESVWAADLGLGLRPRTDVRVALVARSAFRAGSLETAPEPEWEIAASYSRGPVSVAGSLNRDAIGPLSRSLGAEFHVNPIRLDFTLTEIPGSETRAAFSVHLSLPGFSVAAGRETGPTLGESRAIVVGINPGKSSAVAARSARNRQHRSLAGLSLYKSFRAFDQDPIETELDPELLEEEGESALERLAPQSQVQSDSLLWRNSALDTLRRSKTLKAHDARKAIGQGKRGFRLSSHWRAVFGLRTRGHRGLGALAGFDVIARRPGGLAAGFGFITSRDPGEPGAFDERRWSLTLIQPNRFAILYGDLDSRFGSALVLAPPGVSAGNAGSRPFSISPASRSGRTRVAAARGLAVSLHPVPSFSFHGAVQRTDHDARLVSESLWSTGGRFHRSETELERRGALAENLWFLVSEMRSPGIPIEVSVLLAHADYRERSDPRERSRLVPGGGTWREGTWVSTAVTHVRATATLRAEAVLGPDRTHAWNLQLRLPSLSRSRRVGGEFHLLHQSQGYAAATAWPRRSILDRLAVRLHWQLWNAASRLATTAEWESYWSPPGVTVPARINWVRYQSVTAVVGTPRARVSLGWNRRVRWTHPGSAARSDAGLAEGSATQTLTTRWQWRPVSSSALLALGYSRRIATTERETWRFTLAGDRARPLRWDLGLEFRPGVTSGGGVLVEGDPLGGFRFAPSTSPSRLRLRVSAPRSRARTGGNSSQKWPLPGVLALEGLWSVSSQGPRFEIWCTVSGETRNYKPLIP